MTSWVHRDSRLLTGVGVRVAVIDSGWRSATHDRRVLPGVAFALSETGLSTESADTTDLLGHGTTCTQLLLRVAPAITVVPLKVFNTKLETSPRIVEAAIRHAVADRADIITLSLGTRREDARETLSTVCEEAVAAGAIVVAAASGLGHSYPSAFDSVISVGVGPFFEDFAFHVRIHVKPECLASGTPFVPNGVRHLGRSASYAAPRIAGMLALLRELRPGLPIDEARLELMSRSQLMRNAH